MVLQGAVAVGLGAGQEDFLEWILTDRRGQQPCLSVDGHKYQVGRDLKILNQDGFRVGYGLSFLSGRSRRLGGQEFFFLSSITRAKKSRQMGRATTAPDCLLPRVILVS